MKKIIWKLYWLAITMFLLVAVFNVLLNEDVSLYLFVSTCFSFFYVLGLYGYAFDKKIFNVKVWVVISWLIAISIFFLIVSLFIALSGETILIIIGSIIQWPMYYAIFKYSSGEHPVWCGYSENQIPIKILELIKQKGSISTSKVDFVSNGIETIVTTIKKEGLLIKVIIQNKLNGNIIDEFDSDFENIELTLEFIKERTSIKPSSFLREL